MPAFNDIVSQMRAALALADPDLDTSTGTTSRKILDVVAESIAESYLDQHMLSYQYDIDAKFGDDLDQFCQIVGGIVRYGAKRATGTVVFTRSAQDAASTLLILVNTQIATSTSPQVSVTTITPAFMDIGVRTVVVPVQAVDGGAQGNVGAGTLNVLLSPVQGVQGVTNVAPLSGGAAQETDDQLRLRWKQTAFRNIAGSEQFYLGLARADGFKHDPGCTMANVIGASKTYREQVQITSGSAQSQADDVVYAYPTSSVLGADIDGSDVAVRDQDYSFDTTTTPPTIHNLGGLTEGGIYDLVYEYVPVDSRNDGANGITNRIDIWCNGVRPVGAVQSIIFDSTKRFSSVSTDALYYQKFVRPDGTHPGTYGGGSMTKANAFIPLAWGPIVTLPPTLSVAATTYFMATPDHPIGTTDGSGNVYAYQMVHMDGPFGWTPQSLFGIEWDLDHLPPTHSVIVVGEQDSIDGTVVSDYTYNEVPRSIQQDIENWRLTGTDAKVHQAKLQNLRFNLAVILDPKVGRSSALGQIATALSSYCSSLAFDSTVQVGEALRAVLNCSAVTNARFLSANDFPGSWTYSTRNNFPTGIQKIVAGVVATTYVDTNGRPMDVTFGDAELVAFDSLGGGNPGEPSVRAQNTFGSS